MGKKGLFLHSYAPFRDHNCTFIRTLSKGSAGKIGCYFVAGGEESGLEWVGLPHCTAITHRVATSPFLLPHPHLGSTSPVPFSAHRLSICNLCGEAAAAGVRLGQAGLWSLFVGTPWRWVPFFPFHKKKS